MATSPSLAGWIGAGVFVLLGLALLGFGVHFVTTAYRTLGWPTAEGQIERIAIERGTGSRTSMGSEYYASPVYRYTVEGRTYRSSRVSFGAGKRTGKRYPSHEEAQAAAHRYTPGQPVDVRYDPDDPGTALLEPGATVWTYWPILAGLLLLGVGGWSVASLMAARP